MADKEYTSMKFKLLSDHLDERTFRLCLAVEAMSRGRGGISEVAKATGVSRTTLHAGIHELQSSRTELSPIRLPEKRVRKPGAGRKRFKESDKQLLEDLDLLVDPVTRGDRMSPLRWTCKSTTKLTDELRLMGHSVSQSTVWRLLDEMGYSMQSNQKTREGSDHPERNAQFEFINNTVQTFLDRGLPVISVDTKKNGSVGQYKNGGQEWEKKGQPVEVNMHDFADPDLGKDIPYGVYDLERNEGWVSAGVTHDTAEFVVETINRWWQRMGQLVYGDVREILITADGGGSNVSRVHIWKTELQRLSNVWNMTIHVRYFPPGTSKWNKIEHRMFCHITENWRARPLSTHMAIVNLISNTRTNKGLTIRAEPDEFEYETGKKIPNAFMSALSLKKSDFHGEWNYSISPISP
ncbi:MAG: ISAzo13 family transposase [Desulfatirhabdiaceae bacterium]